MKWTEQYNCHALSFGGFVINVNWASTGGGFEVSFHGKRLKNKIQSLNDAKIAGIAFAKRIMKTALDELNAFNDL